MSITKKSKEWTQALVLVPEHYQPNQKCNIDGVAWMFCPHPQFKRYRQSEDMGTVIDVEPHDHPVPDITPDLLYALLMCMGEKGRVDFCRDYEGWQCSTPDVTSGWCESAADAIIRAAASLQEAK